MPRLTSYGPLRPRPPSAGGSADALNAILAPLRKTLAYDQGKEMVSRAQ